MHEINQGRIFMGRVPHDADLLDWLSQFAMKKNIELGEISLVGATKKAVLAFYHQDRQEYEQLIFENDMEILHGVGNVSLKDGQPFVHLHLILSDAQGKCFGGHLVSGTILFACEAIVKEYTGEKFERGMDEVTGLTLWIKE